MHGFHVCVCALLLHTALMGAVAGGVKLENYPPPTPPGEGEYFNFGLYVVPPWEAGGKLLINFPEHLEYDGGMGILRYSDAAPQKHWVASADGMSAVLDVESPTAPGVHVDGTARVVSDERVEFTMRITNRGQIPLPTIRPLYCFQYRRLTGFPQWVGNFKYTFVLQKGKLVAVADLPCAKAETHVKAATVLGCPEVVDMNFARRAGGVVEGGIDAAITAVTSLDGKRSLVIAWTPGRSLLTNMNIPCMHADPYYGNIPVGEMREARGVVILTEKPLAETVEALVKEGVGAPVRTP
jgi:hypothetical protein